MSVYGVLVGAVVGAGITGALNLCCLILRKRNIQSNDTLSGEVFKQTQSAKTCLLLHGIVGNQIALLLVAMYWLVPNLMIL